MAHCFQFYLIQLQYVTYFYTQHICFSNIKNNLVFTSIYIYITPHMHTQVILVHMCASCAICVLYFCMYSNSDNKEQPQGNLRIFLYLPALFSCMIVHALLHLQAIYFSKTIHLILSPYTHMQHIFLLSPRFNCVFGRVEEEDNRVRCVVWLTLKTGCCLTTFLEHSISK